MSDRYNTISKLLGSQKSRTAYIKAKLAVLVPAQIRALRLKSTRPPMPRQRDLARESELHQSRISMFETPGMANITLETLAKVAAGLRSGVVVKFVPFTDMLEWENEFSPDTFDVTPRLDDDAAFTSPESVPTELQAMGMGLASGGNQTGGAFLRGHSGNGFNFREHRVLVDKKAKTRVRRKSKRKPVQRENRENGTERAPIYSTGASSANLLLNNQA